MVKQVNIGMPQNPYIQAFMWFSIIVIVGVAYFFIPQFTAIIDPVGAWIIATVSWTLLNGMFGVTYFFIMAIFFALVCLVIGYLYRLKIEKHNQQIAADQNAATSGNRSRNYGEPPAPPAKEGTA